MEDMNGSGGTFLYNFLSSIFLRPYTVKYKYFLYQHLRYCLTRCLRFFTVSAKKTCEYFSAQIL